MKRNIFVVLIFLLAAGSVWAECDSYDSCMEQVKKDLNGSHIILGNASDRTLIAMAYKMDEISKKLDQIHEDIKAKDRPAQQ